MGMVRFKLSTLLLQRRLSMRPGDSIFKVEGGDEGVVQIFVTIPESTPEGLCKLVEPIITRNWESGEPDEHMDEYTWDWRLND